MHVSAVPDIQPHTASVPPSAWTLCPWDSPKYEHLLEMYSIWPSKMWMSLFLHQIWRTAELHHLLTSGSSALNEREQTAD